MDTFYDDDFPRGKRFITLALEETCVVEVGEKKTRFYIHKSLLIENSEFFKKALSGPWEEARTGVVSLADVEEATFRVFVSWLYTMDIPSSAEGWEDISGPIHSDKVEKANRPFLFHPEILQLYMLKAYILGDRLVAPEFKTSMNNTFIEWLAMGLEDGSPHPDSLSPDTIIFAYANLPGTCKLKEFMVHWHIESCSGIEHDCIGDVDIRAYDRSKLPREFLIDVMIKQSEIISAVKRTPNKAEEVVFFFYGPYCEEI
ncbi:hypothetical protein BU24DRAFT_449675 [Aaosphaeria arxii CBS 175.79]|uniref:BTB domain-containing protein n=1 Tax=Aaosphaeria arxii CBS 175.79 TaxID=1450172 RepID=A0A6A5XZC2_9PLEO|nr:uncharacterized protein BU24DRAFT_449675 [Aaosphaeria arxii CBS 175.79]KAF2018157.1 hypothetical protein BU24DRAFT_449675 [Aaosphaeria arxii CBS 175.79]